LEVKLECWALENTGVESSYIGNDQDFDSSYKKIVRIEVNVCLGEAWPLAKSPSSGLDFPIN